MGDPEKVAGLELEAFKNLLPTANLNSEVRQQLDGFLPEWLESLSRFKENPWAYPTILKLLQKAVLNVDIYSGLSVDNLITPPGEDQDTPLQEWKHQVKNLLMRGDTFNGKDQTDFGSFASDFDAFDKLDFTKRGLLHVQAINYLVTAIGAVDQSGQLIHQPDEQFTRFGKKVTFAELVISGLVHEADHSQYTHSLYFNSHRGFPPIQHLLFGSPQQTP